MKMDCGKRSRKSHEKAFVYAILIAGRIYIGSTVNPKNRFRDHLWALKKQRHTNEKMQSAYNRHGVFMPFVIEECNPESRFGAEQSWIDKFITSKNCLNIARDAKINIKQFMSEDAKRKIGSAHKGKSFPEASKKMVSESLKKYYQTKEGLSMREDISRRLRKDRPRGWYRAKSTAVFDFCNKAGICPSSLSKSEKISIALSGKRMPEETRQKISKSLKGKVYGDGQIERLRAMGASRRGQKTPKEVSEKAAYARSESLVSVFMRNGDVIVDRMSVVASKLGVSYGTIRSWVKCESKFKNRWGFDEIVMVAHASKDLSPGIYNKCQAVEALCRHESTNLNGQAIRSQDFLYGSMVTIEKKGGESFVGSVQEAARFCGVANSTMCRWLCCKNKFLNRANRSSDGILSIKKEPRRVSLY